MMLIYLEINNLSLLHSCQEPSQASDFRASRLAHNYRHRRKKLSHNCTFSEHLTACWLAVRSAENHQSDTGTRPWRKVSKQFYINGTSEFFWPDTVCLTSYNMSCQSELAHPKAVFLCGFGRTTVLTSARNCQSLGFWTWDCEHHKLMQQQWATIHLFKKTIC
jgi:hypothetical protein